MKRTLNITIGGRIFAIEEDAYDKLSSYLEAVKKTFATYPDPEEIIADMEARLAEQLQSMHDNKGMQVITLQHVQAVIAIMGTPEDLEHEAETEEQGSPTHEEPRVEIPRRLYRNPDDKIIFGVCSGLAAYFNIEVTWVRIAFVLLAILPVFPAITIYIIMAIVVPEAKTPTEKMAMRGQPITIAGIKDTLKQEFNDEKNKERVGKIKTLANETSASVRRVYDEYKPGVESTFRKIIRLPFELLINLIKFITHRIFPIIIRISGVFVTLGGLIAIFSIIAGSMFLFFNRGTSYFHWPVAELINPLSYYTIFLSLFIILLIPSLLIIFLGITMVRYRSSFNRAFTLGLVATWVVVGIVGGSVLIAELPSAIQRAPENRYFKETTEVYPLKDFDTLVLSGEYTYTIHQGPEFKVELRGKKPYFNQLVLNKPNPHTLAITKRYRHVGCWGWCFEFSNISIDITLPELKNIEVSRGALVKVLPRQEKSVKASSDYHAMINFENVETKNFIARLSMNGKMGISGAADSAELSLTGGFFWGENFRVKNMKLTSEYVSEALINVANQLTVQARGIKEVGTEIYYQGNPKIISDIDQNVIIEPYEKYLEKEKKRQEEQDSYYRARDYQEFRSIY